MSEHDNDFREVIDEEEDKNADVVEVTGDTTVDPSVADPNNDKKDDYEDICYILPQTGVCCRQDDPSFQNNICICNDLICKRPLIPMEDFGFGSGDNAKFKQH